MGSLDYVRRRHRVLGFVVKSPEAILDTVLAARQGSLAIAHQSLDEEVHVAGFDVRKELPPVWRRIRRGHGWALMPVPSWNWSRGL